MPSRAPDMRFFLHGLSAAPRHGARRGTSQAQRARRRTLHVGGGPKRQRSQLQGLAESRILTPYVDALDSRNFGKPPATPAKPDVRPKTPADSFHSVRLPLLQDKWLADNYVSSAGSIRIGAVLADLDALAGIIAYKHTGEEVTVVTAACDRITMDYPLEEVADLDYSGQVTYASGRSSMEVTCQVAGRQHHMYCLFNMVALDPATQKPTAIAPLTPTNDEEAFAFRVGAQRSAARKARARTDLHATPPDAEESALIHSIWLDRLDRSSPRRSAIIVGAPDDRDARRLAPVPMADTALASTAIMQPTHRNRHNFQIFGGYLMQQTYELAYCCAARFVGQTPRFISLEPSTFLNPVPVGAVLQLKAQVAYSIPAVANTDARAEDLIEMWKRGFDMQIEVRVDSHVRDIKEGLERPTGQFNYTFAFEWTDKEQIPVVVPQSYEESMMYLEARRRVLEGMEEMYGDENEQPQ